MRGRRPSWTACCVMEKAPVITAWLAITAAIVAKIITGQKANSGTIIQKGSAFAAGLASTNAP